MKQFLTFEEVQDKCNQLMERYEIDEEKFYKIIEKWAEEDATAEEKIVASFQELLQTVSDEMDSMEANVKMEATCRLGCAFCCYFPIIINEMEAKMMKKAIERFPQERKQKIHLHLLDYYEKYGSKIDQITTLNYEEDDDFKRKYRKSFVPCPLLDTETNQCMAYEVRPIPCRTYVNYTDPAFCEENLMPKETVSFEFLYEQYMGALNEFMQFLYEEGNTAFINYPDDVYTHDYLANWLRTMN
ncbi:YkgJ family cysteine cluster protein [Oceanobacillus halophilus]|uniref:YkgJ family cysteine cluster protein n=1 Tax=Oceanobacillus halophilus TaxID=930130 RepID=A0A494ZTU6_9BACI|nr:YkgJ family cysteine cluster protein [Oceanobacillus halophilus]RKQ29651.1 YkgJ family cysteine cluster protein [Oceanobacillus halophilus]